MKIANFARIVAVALALAGYAAWSEGRTQPGERLPPGSTREVAGIPLLRLAEAQALWHEPGTLFVDVRPAADYDVGHIAGAVNLPDEDFEHRFPALQLRLERARAVVVYCKSEDCGKSLWTAIRLHQRGLAQTKIYPYGWNEWHTADLPVAR